MEIKAVVTFLMVLVCIERIDADIDETRPPGLFPNDYDKYRAPWTKEGPALVYIQLLIMDVDKVNDGDMEYSIQLYLTEIWKDTRLNLSSFIQEDDIPVFPTFLTQYIWVPDLVFENTKSGMLFSLSLPNRVLLVNEDGCFSRSSKYHLIVSCQMDFRLYPMDTQHCYMRIATLWNSDKKVLLHWAEDYSGELESVAYMQTIEPLKYELLEPIAYKYTEKWPDGNFTILSANLTFVRRVSGSLFNVYVPSTLVVFLSWISFWLEAEAVPARVTLGVTSLLTLATQIVQAHAGLPAISYMTAMDVWLFACLISVFCSLLEFAFSYQLFVLNKQTSIQNEDKEPKFVKPIKELRIPKSRIKQDWVFHRVKSDQKNFVQAEKSAKPAKDVKCLDKICRKLFPFIFSIFSIVYWTSYLSNK